MAEHELAETDGGALVPGPLPLSPKELKFCEAFGNPESETFGRATASAAAAGFIQPRSAGWKLRRRGRIIAKLQEYHAAVRVEIGKVLFDLETERLQALAKGDIATAVRASELQGKHLAMFTDKVAVDDTYVHVYDERLAVEARRITAVLLLNPGLGLPPDVPQLPAAIEAQGPPAEPARATPEQLQALRTPQQERK
jgi:hypothetical protein